MSQNEEIIHEEIVKFGWNKLVYIPIMAAGHISYPIYSESHSVRQKCKLNVFVQGNLNELEGKTIFLTVHDIGKNHQSFVDFVNSQPMLDIKAKSIFLHICVPGQKSGAKELENDFPSMDQIAEALAQVMAKFSLSKCVAVGEGAGADICCRFAMNYRQLVTGIVLIHCTSIAHGFLGHVREIIGNLRLVDGQMGQSEWEYLLTHRFGNHKMDKEQKNFVEHLKEIDRINEANLSHFIYNFAHRDDFGWELNGGEMAKMDAFLVTGGKSAHNQNVQQMFEQMNKSKTALLVAKDCVDVLAEAPEYVTSALILLCQRKGIFADLDLPIVKPAMPESLTCFVGNEGKIMAVH